MTVGLREDLWSESVAVWIFDDRNAFRDSRNISRSPKKALWEGDPDTRYTTSAPFFVGAPHGPLSLDVRRLPTDQPPHLQHQSVESRNPN